MSNATALLVEHAGDTEARHLRDVARAEIKRIEGLLATVAAPVTMPSANAIAKGLQRLLGALADKPEIAHAALVKCGLKLRVIVRPQAGRRFLLVGHLDLGGVAEGG